MTSPNPTTFSSSATVQAEIQRLAQFADAATRLGAQDKANNMETLAQALTDLSAVLSSAAASAREPAPDTELLATLQSIVDANPRKWEELAEPEGEFERWAKARARHAIANHAAAMVQAPKGEVVVTKTQEGQIVAVTRQDEEGRILSVIAESAPQQEGPDPLMGAAEWLALARGPSFDAAVLQQTLSIGYNRARRLVDAVRERRGS